MSSSTFPPALAAEPGSSWEAHRRKIRLLLFSRCPKPRKPKDANRIVWYSNYMVQCERCIRNSRAAAQRH